MNPVAGSLCACTGEEAAGRPLDEVVRLVKEETGQPAENPVERVLATGVRRRARQSHGADRLGRRRAAR